MKRSAVAGAIFSYFATQWASLQPTVEFVGDNREPSKQLPDPTSPLGSSWIRGYLGDIDGPRRYTFGGTQYSGGFVIFQAFSPLDVGTGYADGLIDDATGVLQAQKVGKVEFLDESETFLAFKEETGQWWMAQGRVPFRVLDDG